MQATEQLIEKTCHVFGLGNLVAEAEPISGGRLHTVWRVQTSQGKFAIKMLNKRLMEKESICFAYERVERVARAFQSRGVPAVAALLRDGNCLSTIDNRTVMVFKWIDGDVYSVGSVDAERAEKMGEVLGKIHAINLDASDFNAMYHVDQNELGDLLKRAIAAEDSLADLLKAKKDKLAQWMEQAISAVADLQDNLLLSHGDLDQQNVVWSTNSNPSIIDWEMTGLQNPAVELINLCLDWSGFPNETPSKEAFLACYQGYQNSNQGRTRLNDLDTTFNGEVGYFLRWLSFSLRRTFDTSDTEKEIGAAESERALRSLCLFDEYRAQLQSWI